MFFLFFVMLSSHGVANLECRRNVVDKIGMAESDLGRCTWDQRIPNSPLLERIYLFDRPPVFFQQIPQPTNTCAVQRCRGPYLNNNPKMQRAALRHWLKQITSDGLPVKKHHRKRASKKTLRKANKKHPERPWIYGINKNIDQESGLLHRTPKVAGRNNNRDCMSMSHYKFNSQTDQAHINQYFQHQPFEGRRFNNITTPRGVTIKQPQSC